ncbi:MAG: PEGA domain-containing protein [Myxococcota bacterium]|nr:PEGA domain-containing protein [Myxococcota bacterium]
MRALVIALLAATACTAGGRRAARTRCADDEEGTFLRSRADVIAARELDQQGVRSFREARYVDALRYFRAALRLGGPSSELWNVVRSLERLDDWEGAAVAVDEYLARRDLAPDDRADAEREARALRERTSVLTVTTSPPGATIVLDGKGVAAPTPLSLEVRAGPHLLVLRRAGYAVASQSFEARYGRAVLIALDLARSSK